MTASFPIPSLDDVIAASARIRPLAWHTPFVRSTWLSAVTRADVWLKLEVAQPTGSFKIRGAVNAIASLRLRHPHTKRVVTASAGNHGQAIALAASGAGIAARVYVPATAPAAKRDALRTLGADVIETASYEAAEAEAHEECARTGTPYISPYNDPDVIAGAGTIALEMMMDQPDLDAIIVGLGGGGLLAGTAIAIGAPDAHTVVVGAEAEASPAFSAALAEGAIVTVPVSRTLADGLAGNLEAGSRTFEIVQDRVERIALVAESSIAVAMRELVRHEHLIVEGAGAAGVAALLQGGLGLAGRKIGVVLSGRNVDSDVLMAVMTGSWAANRH